MADDDKGDDFQGTQLLSDEEIAALKRDEDPDVGKTQLVTDVNAELDGTRVMDADEQPLAGTQMVDPDALAKAAAQDRRSSTPPPLPVSDADEDGDAGTEANAAPPPVPPPPVPPPIPSPVAGGAPPPLKSDAAKDEKEQTGAATIGSRTETGAGGGDTAKKTEKNSGATTIGSRTAADTRGAGPTGNTTIGSQTTSDVGSTSVEMTTGPRARPKKVVKRKKKSFLQRWGGPILFVAVVGAGLGYIAAKLGPQDEVSQSESGPAANGAEAKPAGQPATEPGPATKPAPAPVAKAEPTPAPAPPAPAEPTEPGDPAPAATEPVPAQPAPSQPAAVPASRAENLASCVSDWFAGESIAAIPADDIEFVCTEADGYQATKQLGVAIIEVTGGKMDDTMREWARLAWYRMARLQLARSNCCGSETVPFVTHTSLSACKLDEAYGSLAAAGRDKARIATATDDYAAAIECLFKAQASRTFGQVRRPSVHHRKVFEDGLP